MWNHEQKDEKEDEQTNRERKKKTKENMTKLKCIMIWQEKDADLFLFASVTREGSTPWDEVLARALSCTQTTIYMEKLTLSLVGEGTLTQERLNILAGALERAQALQILPTLKTSNIICSLKPGALSGLIRALGGVALRSSSSCFGIGVRSSMTSWLLSQTC